MSNPVSQAGAEPETKRHHSGRAVSNVPSSSKQAKKFDPDLPVWERQPGETKVQYDAFLRFRDSEERSPGQISKQAVTYSSVWSWGWRAYEYDLFLVRKDQEDAVRYRRQMNARQRATSRLAQNKIAQYLMNLDPEKLSPQEAARWYEVAVKIERLAGGDVSDRVDVNHSGSPVDQMSAEEVRDALMGIQAEIERLTEQGQGADQTTR